MSNDIIRVPVNSNIKEYKSEFAIEWEKSKSHDYMEYRRKWVENPKHFILSDGPINLDIESTNYCNLKCPMCPRTVLIEDKIMVNGGKYRLGFIDYDFYKNIIDQAAEMGVCAVKLNWLGEPTMHKNLVDMVRYAKEKGIIDVLINTNAVLLDEKLIRELILAGLDKLLFSFDSPIKENYEKIRVGANFDNVLENIKNVKVLRNSLGSNTPLTRISMVLMKENAYQLDDFVKLFKDIVDIVAYVEFSHKSELINKEKKSIQRTKIKNFACAQLWQRMFVTWDGKVVVCCNDAKMEYVVGDAKKERLKDIWKSEKYQYIRENHKTGNYINIPMCLNCDIPEFDEKS